MSIDVADRVVSSDQVKQVASERHARHRRTTIVGVTMAILTVVGTCLAVSVGEFTIPLRDVVPGLLGQGQQGTVFVLQSIRLPRVLGAIGVGAALAIAGSIFQTVTRNPLASPDFLGITSCASLTACFSILILQASGATVAVMALVGAATGALTIYGLSWKRGVRGYRMILVGIGIGAIAEAAVSWVLTLRPPLESQRALIWIIGSLNDVSTSQLTWLYVSLALAGLAVPLVDRWLGALDLGDDGARGLGLRVEPVRGTVLGLAVVLTGTAVAVGGPIGFIALMAPPIARRLTGSPGLVPLSAALVGALLLLASDQLALHAFGERQIPAGVVTGVLGAPYLMWLLVRAGRTSRKG